MVRLLALLLSLWSSAALAQATFTTVISPTTYATSPTGPVTVGGTVVTSPGIVGVNCISGCASAGNSPATVLVPNTVTTSAVNATIPVSLSGSTSLSGSAGVTQATSPWAVNGNVGIGGTVTVSPVAGTIPTSLTGAVSIYGTVVTSEAKTDTVSVTANVPVVQITSPWAINGQVSIGTSPYNVICVTGCASAGNSPSSVIITAAPTITTSPVAGTIPVATGTVTTSPVAGTIPVAEQNGGAYPNRASWVSGSLSFSTVANLVLVNQNGANKLYITSINCSRNDTRATGALTLTSSPVVLGFAISQTPGQSLYLTIPAATAGGTITQQYNPPIVTSASTSLQFTPNIAIVSALCSAQGYAGP